MALFQNPFTSKPAPAAQPSANNPALGPNDSGYVPPANNDGNPPPKKDGGEPNDPLMDFSKLWEPKVDKDGKPIEPKKATGHLPVVDAEQFQKLVGGIDFTKSLTPEDVEGIKAGGDAAVASLLTVMNKVGRDGFTRQFAAMQKMVEQGLANVHKSMAEQVPGMAKDLMIDTALSQDNPLMSNPVYAPLVKQIKAKIQEAHPKASVGEVDKSVRAYFDNMYADITKSKKKDEKLDTNDTLLAKGDANADWATWFEEPTSGTKPADASAQ